MEKITLEKSVMYNTECKSQNHRNNTCTHPNNLSVSDPTIPLGQLMGGNFQVINANIHHLDRSGDQIPAKAVIELLKCHVGRESTTQSIPRWSPIQVPTPPNAA